MSEMIKINIDGRDIEVKKGISVLIKILFKYLCFCDIMI